MNKKKLKAKIIELGITVEELSQKIGFSESTFYRKVDKNSFTVKEVSKLINILNLTESETMYIFFSENVA